MEKISGHIKERPGSPVTEEIIDFFDNNWGKEDYLSLAAKFVKSLAVKINGDNKLKESFILDRKNYSFYKIENYEQGDMSSHDFWIAIMHLHHWYVEIAMETFPEEKAEEERRAEYYKMVRQVSPPLSAYKMVPFNKMDITYSDKSYGLLYE